MIPVETDTHFVWQPGRTVSLFGCFHVPMYDLCTAVALIAGTLGWLFFTRNIQVSIWKRIAALMIIGSCVVFFTRLFHILFWGLEQTMTHPDLLLQVGHGRSIHGTIVGFGVGAWLVATLWHCSCHTTASAVSFWPVLALICARIGNFWASAMIGTPTDADWGIGFYFSGDHGVIARHPVQLYAVALALLLLITLVIILSRKNRIEWFAPAIALMGLGAIRLCCDFMKEDPGYLLGEPLSTGQWLSIPMILLGGWLLYFPFYKRQHNP